MSNPLVSIIIPTKNSERYLECVLKSTKKQTYKNIEIIVVDNYSTDKTKQISKIYTSHFCSKGNERSTQKNYGAKKSKGDYLLFLDSDAELTSTVIEDCVIQAEKGYEMIIIPEKHIGEGFWAKAKALERECYLGDDTIEAPWFFLRKAFLKVSGYNESLYAGEDWDLFERMKRSGSTYTRSKSFVHHHIGHLTPSTIFHSKFYYGKNIYQFITSNKNSYASKIPLLRGAFIRNWRLLISNPKLSFGIVLIKFIESAAMAIGILAFLISNGSPKRGTQKSIR